MTTHAEESRADSRPLAGLRVLEMGQLIAGPFCGQLFADFGAEVIKVEQPEGGDPMRQWGRRDPDGPALWFPVIARGKKSITLDMRTELGQKVVRDLVAVSDVLIENFRPGTIERWGLGYEVLSKINPRLIMVRVSGFGQTGPYSKRAGYGSIGEAFGGLRYVVGDPSQPPSRVGFSIGDSLAATFACLGAMIALHERQRSGRGQVVDSAIYESVLAITENLVTEYAGSNHIRERTGSILRGIAPSNVYPTSDNIGVLVAANQDSVFRRLCEAMGQPQLADDPKYATHVARGEAQEELDDLISEWTRNYKSEELEQLLEDHGVPAGRMYRAPEMLADPHYQSREAIIEVDQPGIGRLKMQGVAPKLSSTPGAVHRPAPQLGEHNDEVFEKILKVDKATLAQLRKAARKSNV